MGRKVKGRHRLPRVAENRFRCPRCGAAIYWSCSGGKAGALGSAWCSNSLRASQIWKADIYDIDFCIWEGDAERLSNGFIEIWDDLSWAQYPHP